MPETSSVNFCLDAEIAFIGVVVNGRISRKDGKTVFFVDGDNKKNLEEIVASLGDLNSSLPATVKSGFEFLGFESNCEVVVDIKVLYATPEEGAEGGDNIKYFLHISIANPPESGKGMGKFLKINRISFTVSNCQESELDSSLLEEGQAK